LYLAEITPALSDCGVGKAKPSIHGGKLGVHEVVAPAPSRNRATFAI
jgi:hypothetical protein